MRSKEKKDSKDKKRSHKKRSHKERRHKERKEHRDGKDRSRSEKKSKHSRRRSSSSSSGGSSGSEADVATQLARSRAAARATREILAYNYDLRGELRELVRQLDGGGALEVSGIPDAFLRAKLTVLLDNLPQLRKNSAGQYFRRKEAISVLGFIAPLLEETPASLAAYAPKPGAAEAAAAAAAAGPQAPQQNGAAGAAAVAAAEQQDRDEAAEAEQSSREPSPAAAAGPIGPQMGPQAGPALQADEPEGLVESEGEEGSGGEEPGGGDEAAAAEAAAPKRALGPAMPTQQQLEFAAQLPPPESDVEEDLELIGPPPPELEAELDAASMDDRTAEVVRIAKVLAKRDADVADTTAAQAAERQADPYEVLGVEEAATAGEIKKRYWRLSLLIHPDKCDHPQAQLAFQAVTRAHKELQDAALRKAADDRRAEARLRAEFEKEAAAAERQRQWRIMRGEATAEDLAGPAVEQFGGPARESWMTELPPERQAGGGMPVMGTTQVGFSKAGIKGRGDTSEWTLTPAQRAAQLEGGGPPAGPMLITAGPSEAAQQQRLERTAAAIDTYNAQRRKKSLLEKHMEKKQEPAAKKRKKGDKSKKQEPELDYDPTLHPWRPFDREKDLAAGRGGGSASAEDMLKSARALGSRFSGGQGSGSRTFL